MTSFAYNFPCSFTQLHLFPTVGLGEGGGVGWWRLLFINFRNLSLTPTFKPLSEKKFKKEQSMYFGKTLI